MTEKRTLVSNALANVLQTVVGTGVLFGLYRYINTALGVEQLGVWSVVLATVSASRLADMGLSAGVIRFVARDQAKGKTKRACEVIDTTALTLMVTVGATLPLFYPLISKLLPYLFETTYLAQALAILPYALVSLWLTIVAAVFQGGFDGCQRMNLRAGLVVAGQIILLVLAIYLVPRHGLIGLAWAQIGQGLFLMVAGRLLLRRILPMLPMWPRCWRWPVLREMLGYGANVQAATLFMLLLDPVAKGFMAHFGGPAATGYFEMANQVVLKTRSIIIAANRAIVPHVAELEEKDPSRLNQLYHQNMYLLVFISLPSFALLFAWSGLFSWLLVGKSQPELLFLIALLGIAWGSNIFCGPAYFTNMGTGRVGWNTLSHIITGVLNISLGWLLGSIYGTQGVAFAYVIAIIAGNIMLITTFQNLNQLEWHIGFAPKNLVLPTVCALVAALRWLVPLRPLSDEPAVLVAGIILPPAVLGLTVWFHPLRQQLLRWFMVRKKEDT